MLNTAAAKRTEIVKSGHSKSVSRLYFFDCSGCGIEIKVQSGAIKKHTGKCRKCAHPVTQVPEQAAQLLRDEGCTVVSVQTQKISWLCLAEHPHQSRAYDILRGHRCILCSRIGRTPRKPIVLSQGDSNGDLEVVEYLGVVKGHSRVVVKNVVSGVSAEMSVADFRRGKSQLLSEDQLSEVRRQNGLKRKGMANPKNAVYTWGDVRVKCAALGFVFMPEDDAPDAELVSRVIDGPWFFQCHCGRIWKPTTNNIMSGITTSCGCVKSKNGWDRIWDCGSATWLYRRES